MRYETLDWRGVWVETNLDLALRPVDTTAQGKVEEIEAQGNLNSECIGRLAALLVERQVISLGEAKRACCIERPLKETTGKPE